MSERKWCEHWIWMESGWSSDHPQYQRIPMAYPNYCSVCGAPRPKEPRKLDDILYLFAKSHSWKTGGKTLSTCDTGEFYSEIATAAIEAVEAEILSWLNTKPYPVNLHEEIHDMKKHFRSRLL